MPHSSRIQDVREILSAVAERFDSMSRARAWYFVEPLPGFSGATAADLTEQGRAEEVLAYIRAVDAGIFA